MTDRSTTDETPRADGLPRRQEPQAGVEGLAGVEGQGRAAHPSLSPLEIARRVADAAEDKKAADIVVLDVSELTTMADYFVICSGGSERQLGAIADGVASALRDNGVHTIGREGSADSHWLLVDFGSVIVHVFAPPERDFYQLERHWAKAKTILRLQ